MELQKENDSQILKLGCISLLAIAPITALQGFVMQKCWAWFVATSLGVREIGLVEALGLALTMSLFMPHTLPTQENGKDISADKFWKTMMVRLLLPLVTLGIGYVYHLLM